MSISIRKITIVFAILILTAAVVSAQPQGNKVRERISMMKKMKLMDVLNLDEQSSDKFIAQYSSWEHKIDEQRSIVDKTSEDLTATLKKEASNDEITKKTENLLDAQNKLYNLTQDKLRALKSQLSTKDYAKLVVFEDRFYKELQKILFKRGMKRDGGPGRPPMDDE